MKAVVADALVRVICPECRHEQSQPIEYDEATGTYGQKPDALVEFDCPQCSTRLVASWSLRRYIKLVMETA